MKCSFFLGASMFLGTLVHLHAQTIRIEVRTVPAYHADGDSIYIAGSFNGWNPGDSRYLLKHSTGGYYYIDLKADVANGVFKLTRGSWETVECQANGTPVNNRSLPGSGDSLVAVTVQGWADHFEKARPKHTASSQVHVLDTAFYVPQLRRKRRIWIYLPEQYASSDGRYPVLYMHDGQNVFDDATSFSGEWGVDECIDSMKRKCIVVAIDHGGDKRLNEYSPYNMEKYGKGEGAAYADFIVKTLKPFVDKHYRTLKDRPHTYVAGSSMGGLISMYLTLRHPDVFGAAGIFSPSFWIAPRIYDEIKKKGRAVKTRLYFYAAKKESESMVPDIMKVFEAMNKVSETKMTLVIRDEGQHSESSWKKEFLLFYNWLGMKKM